MVGIPLQPDTIEAVADRVAAGDTNAAIRAALGLKRNSLAGIIHRLRRRGDPRVPPAGHGCIITEERQSDLLADAWADGAPDLAAAASRASLSLPVARLRWAEICDRLGRQAR